MTATISTRRTTTTCPLDDFVSEHQGGDFVKEYGVGKGEYVKPFTYKIIVSRRLLDKEFLLGATADKHLLTLDDMTDDSLARIRRQLLRQTSDLAREHLASGREDLLAEAHHRWYEACEIRDHQLARFRLQMRYGARDDGTYSWRCYYSHDEAPHYRLAIAMDHSRFRRGLRHCLAWSA